MRKLLAASMLLLIVVSTLSITSAQAETVTYCDTYVGPLGQFTLDVSRFDIDAHELSNANVVLNVTYTGQLLGQNTSTVLPCEWGFGMSLGLTSQDFVGQPYTFQGSAAADGSIPVAGGVEPNTVTVPLSGTIVAGYSIPWTTLPPFNDDQTLTFATPSLGGVYFMLGTGIFSFSFVITAEVCATYTYDNAVGVDVANFGTMKAMYR